jgi:hypothetical protein
MFANPHLMLDLHATRATGLRAEAARYRLVQALQRHASRTDTGRVSAAAPARRRWPRRRPAATSAATN